MAADRKVSVSPEDLLLIKQILSSRVAARIFLILKDARTLNINSIAMKGGCSNGVAVRHLKNMVQLGVIKEEWVGGTHLYRYNMNGAAELLTQTIRMMKDGGEDDRKQV